MNIPLHYQRKLRKASEGYIGRHGCGWVTDGRFMVKDTLRPQFRRIKLAIDQMPFTKFEYIIRAIDPTDLFGLKYDSNVVMPGAGPFVKDHATPLMCVKLVNSEHGVVFMDKVYFDYFTSLGCTFATRRVHDYKNPVAILYKDDIVGYVMGIRP